MLFNAHFVDNYSTQIVTFEAKNEDEAHDLAEEYGEEEKLSYFELEIERA